MPDFTLSERAVTEQPKFWDFFCNLIPLILRYNILKSIKKLKI